MNTELVGMTVQLTQAIQSLELIIQLIGTGTVVGLLILGYQLIVTGNRYE